MLKIRHGIPLLKNQEKYDKLAAVVSSLINAENLTLTDDVDIAICGVRNKDDVHTTQEGVVRIFVTFPPILPEKNSPAPWHRIIGKMNDSEQDVATWTKSMLSDFVKQRHCDHEWRGVKDCNGVVLKDGRGDCVKCGLRAKDVLPVDNEQKRINLYREENVVVAYPWPDDTSLQGGKQGVVITKSAETPNYVTAFVEAFLVVDGLGIMVRGEAEDVAGAEREAWQKASDMLSCQEHEWDRNVRGSYRKDGYATCVHCGMEASALEPETLCGVCGTPTTSMVGDEFLCLAHKFALTTDEYISKLTPSTGLFGESVAVNDVRERLIFPLYKAMFLHLGPEAYREKTVLMSQVIVSYMGQLNKHVNGDEFQDITVLDGDTAFTADLLRVSLIRSLPEIFGPAYNES